MVPLQFNTCDEFVRYISRDTPIIDKDALLCSVAKGCSVLDVGCINHSYEYAKSLGDAWLHERLRKVAGSLVGLDILKEDAEKLNAEGYNIVVGDAQTFDLGRTFDAVVCGDIIEHLQNPGLFLDRISAHMRADSVAVISTPNPFAIEQVFAAVFDDFIYVNPEHTLWLDPRVTYELVSRTTLRIVGFHWIDTIYKMPVKRRGWRRLAKWATEQVMRRRAICRRDFAVLLKKRGP